MSKQIIIISLFMLVLAGCAQQQAIQPTELPPTAPPTALPPTAPPTPVVSTPIPQPTPSPVTTIRPVGEIAAETDAFMNKLTGKGKFSGIVLVAHDGEAIFEKGYGLADREKQTPVTGQTRFFLGSLTKQFTAAAIMLLEQEGKLSVHDSICLHLPQCPDAWQPITIHHLLTHTAGFPFSSGIPYTNPVSPDDLRAAIEKLRLSEPDARFKYSDAGFILAGLIVEQVSEQPYGEFLQERLFNPTGMADSGYADGGDQLGLGYGTASSTRVERFEPTVDHGAGGVYSTAGDLLRWDQALYTNTPLTAASRERMFTKYTPTGFGGDSEYGYGWFIDGEPGHRLISHGGLVPGFQTEMARQVDDQVTIIVLANQGAVSVTAITEKIFRIVYGPESDVFRIP